MANLACLINPLSTILGLSGLVLLVSGWIQQRRPPKNINWFYGYRTSASMRNQERWDFAQRESARVVMQAGGAMLLLAIPGAFWCKPSLAQVGVGLFVLIGAVVYVFWRVQGQLRKRFGP